jgi:hypothetical protein
MSLRAQRGNLIWELTTGNCLLTTETRKPRRKSSFINQTLARAGKRGWDSGEAKGSDRVGRPREIGTFLPSLGAFFGDSSPKPLSICRFEPIA